MPCNIHHLHTIIILIILMFHHRVILTLIMVQVTILPSEDTDMKLRLPSRSFFCHEICSFREHILIHVYMYSINTHMQNKIIVVIVIKFMCFGGYFIQVLCMYKDTLWLVVFSAINTDVTL